MGKCSSYFPGNHAPFTFTFTLELVWSPWKGLHLFWHNCLVSKLFAFPPHPLEKKAKNSLFFREIAHYFIKACFLLIFECFANARTTWKTSGTTLALDISKSPLDHRTKASCSWVKTMTTRTEFLGEKDKIIIIRSKMKFHLDVHLL